MVGGLLGFAFVFCCSWWLYGIGRRQLRERRNDAAKRLYEPMHDVPLSGALPWIQLGQRCPELLGLAADRVLGQPVVQHLINEAKASEHWRELEHARAVGAAPVSSWPEGTQNTAVYFKPGEPRTLSEYPGQPHITTYLEALVQGTPAATPLPSEHQLFLGPAGQGKSLLAKCFAAALDARATTLGRPTLQYLEAFPSDLTTVEQQDALMRRCQERPTVLFIDELHGLAGC